MIEGLNSEAPNPGIDQEKSSEEEVQRGMQRLSEMNKELGNAHDDAAWMRKYVGAMSDTDWQKFKANIMSTFQGLQAGSIGSKWTNKEEHEKGLI